VKCPLSPWKDLKYQKIANASGENKLSRRQLFQTLLKKLKEGKIFSVFCKQQLCGG